MLVQVMSAIQISNTISTVGNLKLSVGIGVYKDDSYTNGLSTIDWGTLEPGATQNYWTHTLNEGGSALTLSMSTDNWSPSTASDHLTSTWSFNNGQKIDLDEFVEVTLTLTVGEGITGITSFKFDLIAEGRG